MPNLTREVDLCTVNDDADLGDVVHTSKPAADAVREVRSEPALVSQVPDLFIDFDLVRDQRCEGCQWENTAEQDNVTKLLNDLLIK